MVLDYAETFATRLRSFRDASVSCFSVDVIPAGNRDPRYHRPACSPTAVSLLVSNYGRTAHVPRSGLSTVPSSNRSFRAHLTVFSKRFSPSLVDPTRSATGMTSFARILWSTWLGVDGPSAVRALTTHFLYVSRGTGLATRCCFPCPSCEVFPREVITKTPYFAGAPDTIRTCDLCLRRAVVGRFSKLTQNSLELPDTGSKLKMGCFGRQWSFQSFLRFTVFCLPVAYQVPDGQDH